MKTILIIDDDSKICESTKVLLEDEYNVLTALSGAEGLYILSKERISLILLDYSLPDMDGIKVLKNIKEHYKIPVIIITGLGDKELVLKSWRHKADYYLDKPFKPVELKEKMAEILKQADDTFPFETLNLDLSRLSTDIRSALEFIKSNLNYPNSEKLTLKEISAVTSLSPKYLSDLFRKECGYGLYEVITALKIERAKEMLKSGMDIKEIAFGLGYDYPNNLCRFIKNATGKSLSDL